MVENIKNWRLSKIADEHGLEDLERYTLPISIKSFASDEGVSEEMVLDCCTEQKDFAKNMAIAARVMAKNPFVQAAYINDRQTTAWPSEERISLIAKAIAEIPTNRKSRKELIQEKIQVIADEHKITDDYLIYTMREVLLSFEKENGWDAIRQLSAIGENPKLGLPLIAAAQDLAADNENLKSYLKDRLADLKSS